MWCPFVNLPFSCRFIHTYLIIDEMFCWMANTYLHLHSTILLVCIPRVQNTHHKFMCASYMKHFTKFLAFLHHNASYFNFCFIINFGFIKNLLHILKFWSIIVVSVHCLRSLCCWLSLFRVVRFSTIFGSTSMQIFCYYNARLGKCLTKSQ